ncbi:polysaccharide biosynthesis/export family protein [Falsiroseomonas sp. HW251]|uniref:polysaccharide biosynthesis/export family protein n=1 Tax=Falsiroseomonas sp. HW251 TaxID=3390998 RepID=UPI003D314497
MARPFSFRTILRGGICLTALLCLASPSSLSQEYRLQPGDVVEVSIIGPPDLLRRVAVQTDGSLPIPLAGRVAAAGASLAELEARIQTALGGRPMRAYTTDGREVLRFVEREQISVAVVEYRPVSVMGSVARPGEQPFRPRMTVHHVLASAGGTATGRPEAALAGEAAQLRGEYATTWIALAAEQARVWRLRAELGDQADFDHAALPPSPVPDRVTEQLVARETEYRSTRDSDHAREKTYLAAAAAEAEVQINVLTDQNAKEREGVEEDTAELARTMDLLRRGMVTQSRVIDARRVLLYSSTRALQTAAQLASVRRQRGELLRELERMDDRRRIRLIAELQEALPKLSMARARLESVQERLGAAGVPLTVAQPDDLLITIVREGAGGREISRAELDTELQPGDIVNVGPGGGASPATRPESVVAARPGAAAADAVTPPAALPQLEPAPAAAAALVPTPPPPHVTPLPAAVATVTPVAIPRVTPAPAAAPALVPATPPPVTPLPAAVATVTPVAIPRVTPAPAAAPALVPATPPQVTPLPAAVAPVTPVAIPHVSPPPPPQTVVPVQAPELASAPVAPVAPDPPGSVPSGAVPAPRAVLAQPAPASSERRAESAGQPPAASTDLGAARGAAPAERRAAPGMTAAAGPAALAAPQPSPVVERAGASAAANTPDQPERDRLSTARMVERGQALLALGDISGARRFFERAAQGGSAEGALAAGGTHDPAVLARLNARGVRPDPAAAAEWYRRAATLGDAEAETRLARLGAGASR